MAEFLQKKKIIKIHEDEAFGIKIREMRMRLEYILQLYSTYCVIVRVYSVCNINYLFICYAYY